MSVTKTAVVLGRIVHVPVRGNCGGPFHQKLETAEHSQTARTTVACTGVFRQGKGTVECPDAEGAER